MAKPTDAQIAAYYAWCTAEAKKINSDGCTAVSEWHQQCCFEHDLGIHYKKDPRAAFALAIQGIPNPWDLAPELSRREDDKRFAECNFKFSKSWKDKLRTGVRYIGVRLGAFWPF